MPFVESTSNINNNSTDVLHNDSTDVLHNDSTDVLHNNSTNVLDNESTENVLDNNSIKPVIYTSSDAKTVLDYGTHVVLITGEKNKLSALLYTNPQSAKGLECYIPLTPFLNKYKSLYYKSYYITEDLITVFFDW
jgi:hypothetical protein